MACNVLDNGQIFMDIKIMLKVLGEICCFSFKYKHDKEYKETHLQSVHQLLQHSMQNYAESKAQKEANEAPTINDAYKCDDPIDNHYRKFIYGRSLFKKIKSNARNKCSKSVVRSREIEQLIKLRKHIKRFTSKLHPFARSKDSPRQIFKSSVRITNLFNDIDDLQDYKHYTCLCSIKRSAELTLRNPGAFKVHASYEKGGKKCNRVVYRGAKGGEEGLVKKMRSVMLMNAKGNYEKEDLMSDIRRCFPKISLQPLDHIH
eukprot:TRINITY_DN4415_c0_g1_i2.p1 TRINITY_DN4415_c0_g1~~TRINITY_DN4415_c0_g1_i2.p1  ORF type:complete len:260 (-),score=-1.72 TRINITY_DN4415_c0_g1_i2:35-814(-)